MKINRTTISARTIVPRKLVWLTALTPALSPEERGNRSPRFDGAVASGGSIFPVPNKKVAAIATGVNKIFSDVDSFPLSLGERVRVRASVMQNKKPSTWMLGAP